MMVKEQEKNLDNKEKKMMANKENKEEQEAVQDDNKDKEKHDAVQDDSKDKEEQDTVQDDNENKEEQGTVQDDNDEQVKLEEKILQKEQKIKEYEVLIEKQNDRYLRLQADFDNYRKRMAREKEDIYIAALEDLMIQLLPIIDNFERALDSFKASNLDSKFYEGLEMIYKEFLTTLEKNGLKEIEALDCIFDPNKHHAVMKVETEDEDEDNKIKEVFQKGYMLKTKVIRPSMVRVAIKN